MLKVTAISSIDYLTDSAEPKGQALAYYTDSDAEPPGQIWCPGNWLLPDGALADVIVVKRMAQGRHPKTGKQLVEGNGIGKTKSKRVGYDLTFSAPNSWSALWAVSDAARRANLDEMLMASVREVLDEILERGLLEARLGKGGKRREPLKSLVAALYRHRTSREGDPQAHVHVALMNMGLRQDGSIRAINNEKLCEAHKVMGALFRLKLAEKLELSGVKVEADAEYGFLIQEQPEALLDVWSKRRKQIEQAAKKEGLARTAGHMKEIDVLVKRTRQAKVKLPDFKELEACWKLEALEAGWQPSDEWCHMGGADGPAIPRTEAQLGYEGWSIIREAIDNLTQHHSVFTKNDIEYEAFVLAVGRCSAEVVKAELSHFIECGMLVDLLRDGLFTTYAIIEQEQAIIEAARQRQNDHSVGFSPYTAEMALSDPKFSEEQRQAIIHALLPDGVCVIEGGPGVGKTTAASALKQACDVDGRRLLLLAPSWTAAETLKMELNHKGICMAIDKLLTELRFGRVNLGSNDVLLMDEAGMSSTMQMLELLNYVNEAGAKLVLQGDTNQIAAVNRGDPLSLLSQAIGSQEIRTIRRQKQDWQRKASMQAQDGEIAKAMGVYAAYGDVSIGADRDAVLEAMAQAYKEADGDAVALAATNEQVGAINLVLRQAAKEMGLVQGPELEIDAIPRGQKQAKKKGKKQDKQVKQTVKLPLATGDRLILGAEMTLHGITLRNASRLSVKSIDDKNRRLSLQLEDGQILTCTADELACSGKNNAPIVMQHAYALTTHAAQGATWNQTLWFASHEDKRSALVAMTRHRDKMQVFIDKSSVRNIQDSAMNISKAGIKDPAEPGDTRSDKDIVQAVGKSMQRITRPRNALDIIGIPKPTTMPELRVVDGANPVEDLKLRGVQAEEAGLCPTTTLYYSQCPGRSLLSSTVRLGRLRLATDPSVQSSGAMGLLNLIINFFQRKISPMSPIVGVMGQLCN